MSNTVLTTKEITEKFQQAEKLIKMKIKGPSVKDGSVITGKVVGVDVQTAPRSARGVFLMLSISENPLDYDHVDFLKHEGHVEILDGEGKP